MQMKDTVLCVCLFLCDSFEPSRIFYIVHLCDTSTLGISNSLQKYVTTRRLCCYFTRRWYITTSPLGQTRLPLTEHYNTRESLKSLH